MSNDSAKSDLTSGENEDFSARPNRVPWPPILLVFCIFDGWITGKLLPVVGDFSMVNHFFMGEAQVWLGRLIIAVAIGIDLWVLAIFKKHRTNIRPDRPAEALVTSGPFAFSRNPIYVGNVMIILGFGFMKGSMWYLLLVPFLFFALEYLAIKREEAHMAARFGQAWMSYASRVRRWL